MVNFSSKKTGDLLLFLILIAVLVVVNQLAATLKWRADLTEEKRYTISDASIELLSSLESTVYVDVYLDGDLPAGFQRLQRAIKETLDEFKIYSGSNVEYTFIDPSEASSQKARNEFYQSLTERGLQPTNIFDSQNGERSEKIIFPGAILSYRGMELSTLLLKGNKRASSQEQLNQSIEGIEYELSSTIKQLTNSERKRIGYVLGHNELEGEKIAGLRAVMQQRYSISSTGLNAALSSSFDALMIAQPKKALTENEKYYLDQYVMKGGKVLFFIDALALDQDSASGEGTIAIPVELNMDDMLFKYGIRINKDYIIDLNGTPKPVVVGTMGDKPQMQLLPWPFFPLVINFNEHPISRNLDGIVTRYISSTDTVKAVGITKTPLLFSSQYSKKLSAPVKVSLNDLRAEMKPEYFTDGPQPLAWLLEGQFTSLYKNRFKPEGIDESGFLELGESTKIIVVADADMLVNEINPQNGQPYELGFEPYSRTNYANADFVTNALAYLLEDEGIILSRAKELKIRPLDKVKIKEGKKFYQLLNILAPIIFVLIFAIIKALLRKRKYSS